MMMLVEVAPTALPHCAWGDCMPGE